MSPLDPARDGPLFGHPVEPAPHPRAEPSQVIAAQRRRAKAARIRAGLDKPIIAPGLNAEGEVIFHGVIPRATYADEWRAFCIERPDALAIIERVAFEHAARTLGMVSIAAVWEECRNVIEGGLDQNHRAPAVRDMMRRHAALRGRFRVRGNAGQVPERGR